MATQAHRLTLQVAAAAYKDMLEMVEGEKRLRKALLEAVIHPSMHPVATYDLGNAKT